MKYLKTYAIYGVISASKVFVCNGLRMRANFEGGAIGANGVVPALFKTSDPIVQHAVENSKQFLNGEVYEQESIEIEGEGLEYMEETIIDNPEGEDGIFDNPNEKTVVESVTNFQGAKSYLLKEHNVPLQELQNKEAVLKKASELNVEFPNMK